MKLDGIDLTEFVDGATVLDLYSERCRCVPSRCGVYVLLRDTTARPAFLRTSRAGRFKNLEPSYPARIVKSAWVTGAHIVYVGKAAGTRGLKQRIRQLVDFGFEKPVGHRGGRLLWHLRDHRALRLQWFPCARSRADKLETWLINQFRTVHGTRPFANQAK